ncbi:type II toxin-antitoxin system VapC family toxin [Thermococcus indicus]|uniref:Type II toxin-antitoxin system VapC family toxin n=1 Tax=Thermococcus indicus TaxID=2586643 RepID=A0A4Y5SKK0_9EURY|nr:type II toxin-antitoxin system VapC family toxin [Thermococcus indicus]QDA30669.1 type II toxin-antitoxin system VapC family toxin [Thermococcus indicus]
MRFVVDASLLIDAFSKFNEERRRLALKVFEAIEGHEIYVPRICMIEFVNVLSRFTPEEKVRGFLEVFDFFNLVGESEFFDEAVELAFGLHSRAADTYYISTAMIVGGILLTNDRRMVENARGSGLDVYYILEESDAFFKLLEVSG